MIGKGSDRSDFFVAGGTLRPSAPSYVKRPADDELFDLTLAGRLCYVLTARQMGKSSLMVRTAQRLEAEGVKTVRIDLTGLGTGVTAEHWYRGLIRSVQDQLQFPVAAEDWWAKQTSMGTVERFTSFLRNVVLEKIKGPIVIFVDEIDVTLNLDFSDDFFTAIRFIYNARANDPVYNRLTFVLLGVAMPADLIKDRTRTPFNIGEGIALREFSRQDALVLERGLRYVYSEQGEPVFARIFYWTSGHPYLTQKLCSTVVQKDDERWTDERVDALVQELFLSEEARRETNLQFVRDRINHSPEPERRKLLTLYRRIYRGKEVPEDERSLIQNRLKLYGLVRARGGTLEVRNKIYRHVFAEDWIKETMPVSWTRRVGLISAVAMGVLVLLLSIALVVALRYPQLVFVLQGGDYREIDNLDQVISDLDTVVEILPWLPAGHYYRGIAYQWTGSLEEANRSFERAIELAPGYARAYRSRGRVYERQADYRQAIADYTEAIRLKPDYVWAYHNRGNLYRKKGDLNSAIGDLTKAIELNHVDRLSWPYRITWAYYSRGSIYLQRREYEQAMADYDATIELDSGYVRAYSRRATIYEEQGNPNAAADGYINAILLDPDVKYAYDLLMGVSATPEQGIAYFTRIIEQAPNNEKAYAYRGLLYQQLGDFDEAIVNLNKSIEIQPNATAYAGRGSLYLKMGDTATAARDFNRATALDQDSMYYSYYSLWDPDDPAQTIANLSNIIDVAPSSAGAYLYRGQAYDRMGDTESAIADFFKALELDPNLTSTYTQLERVCPSETRRVSYLTEVLDAHPYNPMVYQKRGLTYHKSGDIDRAIADLSRAIELDPDNALHYLARGQVYHSAGDFRLALGDYNTAARLAPANASVYLSRGDTYQSLGDISLAVADYARVVNLEPYSSEIYSRLRVSKDPIQTVAYLSELIKTVPDNAEAYSYRAQAYRDLNELDKARSDLSRAIELRPERTSYYLDRGNILMGMGDSDSAMIDYIKAIELAPYSTTYDSINISDKPEENIEIFTNIIAIIPTDSTLYIYRGKAYYASGNYEKAVADFTKAIHSTPQPHASAYMARGDFYYETNDYEKAITDYTMAIKAAPNNSSAYVSRGRAFWAVDNIESAIADYYRASELAPYQTSTIYKNLQVANDPEQTISNFTKLLELAPQSALAYTYRGQAYYVSGDHQKAIVDLSQAIELDEDDKPAYIARGDVYRDTGNIDGAIADYLKASELAPYQASSILGHLQVANDPEQTAANFTRLLALSPTNIVAYTYRGQAYHASGAYEKAVADLSQAIELDTDEKAAYVARGHVYRDLGNIDSAIADYLKASELAPYQASSILGHLQVANDPEQTIVNFTRLLELSPDNTTAYAYRAQAFRLALSYQQAIADLTRAIELDADSTDFYISRGDVYRDIGDFDSAIADYNSAVSLNSSLTYIYSRLQVSGDTKQTIDNFTRLIEFDPANSAAYTYRGQAYLTAGLLDAAIADFGQVLALEPDNFGAYIYLGRAYKRAGDTSTAILNYSKAIELESENPTGFRERGHVFRDAGDFEAAINDYSRVIALNPDSANSYLDRGRAYADLDRLEQAIADFTTAIQLRPDYSLVYRERAEAYEAVGDVQKAILDYEEYIELARADDPARQQVLDRLEDLKSETDKH